MPQTGLEQQIIQLAGVVAKLSERIRDLERAERHQPLKAITEVDANLAAPGLYNEIYRADTSTTDVEFTLPAATNRKGWTIYVKKIAPENFAIVWPDGSDTIDGASELFLTTEHEAVMLVSDGVSEWSVFGLRPHWQPLWGIVYGVAGGLFVSEETVVLVDTNAAPRTFALPPAANHMGWGGFIMNIGANICTINPDGAELINGAATLDLPGIYDGAFIICSGSAWFAFIFA